MKDRKIIFLIFGIIILVLSIGISYAYFSAKIQENNKTETVIKTNKLTLVYTGGQEIKLENIIPGDSAIKTFTVENTSNTTVEYNIYMEGITNEFNGDLVYSLLDDNNRIIEEKSLPSTNSGKTYLMSNISIKSGVLKKYKMIITYKYTDKDQNAYQGASFKATLGIDTEKTLSINKNANYSIYSWDQNMMSDYYVNDVLNTLKELKITDLYQSFNDDDFEKDRTKKFITKLTESNINTYFLTGNATWYKEPSEIKKRIDLISDYNSKNSNKIKGIVLDIEPYGSAGYGDEISTGFATYVETIEDVCVYAKEKNVKVVNVIPNWYNKYTTEEKVDETFKEQVMSLLERLIKAPDRTSIMTYNKEYMFVDMDEEVEIAKNNDKEIESLTEFNRLDEASGITKYLTYWTDNNPIGTCLNNWNKMNDKYNYEKLGYSYHYLSVIMELKSNHKLKKNIITFVDESDNSLTTGDVKITINNKNIYDYINYYGKITFLAADANGYNIEINGYSINNIEKISEEDNIINMKYTLTNKEKYQLEGYPVIQKDGNNNAVNSGKIIITDSNFGISKEYDVNTNYFFFARDLISETPYDVKLILNNKTYKLKSIIGNSDQKNDDIINNNENKLYITKGFKKDLYIGASLYFEEQ